MTISSRVQQELTAAAPNASRANNQHHRKRSLSDTNEITPQQNTTNRKKKGKSRINLATINEENKGKAWTKEEHARFLEGLALYPSGPWKAIAAIVQSKSPRQTMTHAQKYRQKHERRARGLRKRRTKAVDRRSVIQVADASIESTDEEFNYETNMENTIQLNERNSEVPHSNNYTNEDTVLNYVMEGDKENTHEHTFHPRQLSAIESLENPSSIDNSHPSCAIAPESPRSCEAHPELTFKNQILVDYNTIYESLFSPDNYNLNMETVIFELESNPPVVINAIDEWWEYSNVNTLEIPSYGHSMDDDLNELSQDISWSTYDL